MAETYVVDASVVAKWFNKGESNEAEAIALRKAWISGDVELMSPTLLHFEVANSIWKNPNVSARRARSLVRILVKLVPKLVDLGGDEADRAMLLARRKNLTYYDASYLALAKSLSVPFITADQEQLDAAEGYVDSSNLSSIGGLA
jgi:predicted nucleic acid-binding protein